MKVQLSWNQVDIQGARILAVDDHPKNLELLEAYLDIKGYEILKANSGRECLEILEKQEVDVLLLDIMMPEMDGFEVLQKLKANPQWSRLPVILITALQEREDRLRGLKEGADEFLTKPVDRLELYARLQNLLRSKRLFDQLERAYKQLERLQKSKEKLIDMTIHDLKNSAAGILGNLQLLKMKIGKAGAEEKLRRYQGNGEKSTRNLLSMISEILDVSRMKEDAFPLQLKEINLIKLIEEVRGELDGLARSSQKEIVFSPDRDCLNITLDPKVTRRIFTNLLINGLSFTPPQKTVTIQVKTSPSMVQIFFCDEGPGISPEYQEKIFDEFVQGDLRRAGLHKGHGLGLAFCQQATRAQKGRIYVHPRSAEGKGATFVVEFPLTMEML